MSRTERNASTSLPLQPVTFERVTFTDNFWAPRQKLNREVTLPHHLETTRGLVRDFESLAEHSATKGTYAPSRDQHLWSDMFVHNVTEALAATLALSKSAVPADPTSNGALQLPPERILSLSLGPST